MYIKVKWYIIIDLVKIKDQLEIKSKVKFLPSKIGPIVGFIGGLILIVPKIIFLINGADPNSTMLLTISVGILCGVLIIAGFMITLVEIDIGYYVVFIAGVACAVGIFIPIRVPILNYFQSPKLIKSYIFNIDVALMFIGGIFSLISVRKDLS